MFVQRVRLDARERWIDDRSLDIAPCHEFGVRLMPMSPTSSASDLLDAAPLAMRPVSRRQSRTAGRQIPSLDQPARDVPAACPPGDAEASAGALRDVKTDLGAELMADQQRGLRTATRLGERLHITVRTRIAIRKLCAEAGPQHLLLTWPGGVNYLPATIHDVGPYDVVVGHLARCPIYADIRQLDMFRTHRMLIDVNDTERTPRRPLLKTVAVPAGPPRRRD